MDQIRRTGIGSDGQIVPPMFHTDEKVGLTTMTGSMIFNVDIIVSYLSKFMSLQAGDIITTGTPPGVGMGMKPQQFLKAGDTMKLSIENLGEQNSKVVAL